MSEANIPRRSIAVQETLEHLKHVAENPEGLNLTGFVDNLTSRYFYPSREAEHLLTSHQGEALRLNAALTAFNDAIQVDTFPMERVKERQAVGNWLQALNTALGASV